MIKPKFIDDDFCTDHVTKIHSQDCHNLHIDVTFSDHAVFKLASKNNKGLFILNVCFAMLLGL